MRIPASRMPRRWSIPRSAIPQETVIPATDAEMSIKAIAAGTARPTRPAAFAFRYPVETDASLRPSHPFRSLRRITGRE